MRPAHLFVSATVAGMASMAGAACTDTLFLQSITVFRQSIKNSATLGQWDSVRVNPWDSLDLLKAAPVEAYGPNYPDTSTHVLRFQYDCGSDSVSSVLSARVVDKMLLVGEDYVHVKSSGTYSTNQRVVMLNGEGAGVDVDLETGDEHWSILWEGGKFEVGRKEAGQPRLSYDQRGAGYVYTKTRILTSFPGSYPTSLPYLALLDGTLESFLGGLTDSVGHVGTSVDSVRTHLVRYRYEYDRTMPTSVAVGIPAVRSSFDVTARSTGWEVRLPQVAPVSILSLEGRSVRRFPAANSVIWDGRDANGLQVRPGVWFVHAQGIGSASILVR